MQLRGIPRNWFLLLLLLRANHYIDHRLLKSSGDATAGFKRHRLGASYDAAAGTAAVFPRATFRTPTTASRPWSLEALDLGGFRAFCAHTQSASVLLFRSL